MSTQVIMWSRQYKQLSMPQLHSRALITHAWDFKRLNNSIIWTCNIPDCQNERPKASFCEPKFILHARCCDPESIVDDLIISRHKNRTSQFGGKEFFSLVVSARTLVGKQFLKKLHNTKIKSTLLTNFDNDSRIRVGITATHDDVKGKALFCQLLDIIQELCPITVNHSEIFAPFIATDFVETETLQALPYDKGYKPTYLNNLPRIYQKSSYIGAYKEDDESIPIELPDIHKALLNNDQSTVICLLAENPELVNKKDPYGVIARHLAYELGPVTLFELFVAARKQCLPKNQADYEDLQHEVRKLKEWKAKNIQTYQEAYPSFLNKSAALERKRYMDLLQTPAPKREALHLACIEGDLPTVRAILRLAPERIDDIDPLGYKPIVLAAANGHAELVRWLVNLGANTESVFYQNGFRGVRFLNLMAHAKTPEVLQAVLKGDLKEDDLNHFLLSAIQNNEIRLARYLSYHLKQWPLHKGLSALEFAMRLSNIHGLEMVKTLLMMHTKPLVIGPYDTDLYEYLASFTDVSEIEPASLNINPSLIPLIEEHNKRLANKENKSIHVVKHLYDMSEKDQLISTFIGDDFSINSTIKRTGILSENERQAVHELFFSNFEMLDENTEDNQRKYLSYALEDNNDKPSYIQLFYHNKRLVAFMTFEFFSIENVIVFHGKLTANRNEALYASQKLVSLVFRAAVATKLLAENERVLVYCKAIYPGLGLCAALPKPTINYFPKKQQKISESLVKQIVAATGEEMNNEKIRAKLRVKTSRALDKKNSVISLFSDLTGGLEKDAMPLCFELDAETIEAYLELFNKHNIDEISIKNFAILWREFKDDVITGSYETYQSTLSNLSKL